MDERVTATDRQGRQWRFAFADGLELATALVGLLLIAVAAAADSHWYDRHFLPNFFTPHPRQLAIADGVRLFVAAAGLAILVTGRPAVRRYARTRSAGAILGTTAMTMAAGIAAVLTTELILRTQTWHAALFHSQREPVRIYDSKLGWIFKPSRLGHDEIAGKQVGYAIDANGYRVADMFAKIDFSRPTIIVSGESVMAGAGLQWDKSVPGQLAGRLSPQIADIAVSGYSTDQSYLRLEAELPRFQCPVAVVTLFTPSFLQRNLNDDRPHLDQYLRRYPAQHSWRLESFMRLAVEYHRKETIDAGIAMTSAVLKATNALAQARGARSLLVVFEFAPESAVERALRTRILDETGLDYVLVRVGAAWRIEGDMHPDERGARAIAAAIATRLNALMPVTTAAYGKPRGATCGKFTP